jgi:hypothetical protein
LNSPGKFINTIERCHKTVPSSHFERISLRQTNVDLWIEGLLSVPISEDKGILILTASPDPEPANAAYFIDLRTFKLKPSKFRYSLGAITDWKLSYQSFDQRINFLTERQQILRFENHACEWTLFDIPFIDRNPQAARPDGAQYPFDDEWTGEEIHHTKNSSEDYLYSNGNDDYFNRGRVSNYAR